MQLRLAIHQFIDSHQTIQHQGGEEMPTVTELQDMLSHLHDQLKIRERAVEAMRRDIEAVERTIAIMRIHDGAPLSNGASEPISVDPSEVMGASQMDALMLLADRNGGLVRVKEAKRLFVEAGLTKSKKAASQIITSRLIRSGRFEWAESGTYRRIEDGEHSNGHQQGGHELITIEG